MHQPVNTFFQFHKRTEGSKITYRAGMFGTDRKFLLNHFPGVGGKLLESQGNLPLLRLNAQHYCFHLVALFQHLSGIFYMLRPAHLGNMNQPLNSLFQFHKCPIISQTDHCAFHRAANREPFLNFIPGMRLKLFETQRYASFFLVKFQDHHVDFLVKFHYLGGMVHPPPRKIGNMQQPVHATQINKHAKIGYVFHQTATHLTFF